jgi:galactitol PTS system EIIB component
MEKTKVVLVACGTAVATSTVVARAIEEACKQAGIRVMTRQCKASEVMSLIPQGADLIVTTTPAAKRPWNPCHSRAAFLNRYWSRRDSETNY